MVVETEEAVVTVETRGEDADPSEGETSSSVWRGCAPEVGVQVDLHAGFRGTFAFSNASDFKLTGPFAAFRTGRAEDKYESFERLVTVDLRTGRRWESAELSPVGAFAEHAVNRRGDAAWIRSARVTRGRSRSLLFVRHAGRVARRDSSSRPMTSLRLTETRVSWREGGRRRSRPLR